MNSKGQLFSLDLVIALALIVLAVGLLYRNAELFQYANKDSAIQAELYRVGLNASNQLVGNPQLNCALSELGPPTGLIEFLPNCLTVDRTGNLPSGRHVGWGKTAQITKDALGIPDDYSCNIEFQPPLLTPIFIDEKGCDDSYATAGAENIFSIERKVVFLNKELLVGPGQPKENSGHITKSELEDCRDDPALATPCLLMESTATLRVWKS
ncbi:MAG: hypothetical protein J4478_04660 [Candidatus Diapherotrites archaeon]|uniref:Uncharacterized protein n=1 Tax=Candidatus Iainarchaeum sp. TaxID=3101447 RepID=A0A8T4KWD0_9ARCH|nr:MAG: hypothetical protein QT12_C0006G0003 [archaeon GW2011_AR21]MBS3058661.1 hypothetical protein [Candidatus Diapherotrites archaeon]